MELRGKGSVTGSNQPLIVIDGVPMVDMGSKYGDSASEINKDDIESVTVLTGGAATALYGSRGGNGVILYTTKSGKGGKLLLISTLLYPLIELISLLNYRTNMEVVLAWTLHNN